MTNPGLLLAATALALVVMPSVSVAHVHAAACKADAAMDRSDIARLERRWIADIARGDRRDLAAILADDYMDIDWRGHRRDKHALLDALRPDAGRTQRISALQVRTWGDAAVATGTNRVHSSAQGRNVEVSFSDVFACIDGDWRAVSSQETVARPPAGAATPAS